MVHCVDFNGRKTLERTAERTTPKHDAFRRLLSETGHKIQFVKCPTRGGLSPTIPSSGRTADGE